MVSINSAAENDFVAREDYLNSIQRPVQSNRLLLLYITKTPLHILNGCEYCAAAVETPPFEATLENSGASC